MNHDLPLHPVPNPGWQQEWDCLMQDPWLFRKLNRENRVREHWEYVEQYLPELATVTPDPRVVLDVGPGCGELLEIARQHNYLPLGVDAAVGEGGMGNAYLRASQLVTQRQDIPVYYEGLLPFARRDAMHGFNGDVSIINSRGSIEQAFSDYMEGEPHHTHQCCRKLRWKETEETARIITGVWLRFSQWLRPGGILLVHANGSADDTWYDETVRESALLSGLALVYQEGLRLHKWIREN